MSDAKCLFQGQFVVCNVSLIDVTILTISGDVGNLVASVSNVTARTIYRRTGRPKRMKQKQLFNKP